MTSPTVREALEAMIEAWVPPDLLDAAEETLRRHLVAEEVEALLQARAAIAALRARPPLDGAELERVAQVLYEAHPQAGAWPALDSTGRQVWFGIARVAEAVLRARPEDQHHEYCWRQCNQHEPPRSTP